MIDIKPHKHCIVCGNAIGEGIVCDELCESKLNSSRRRQRLMSIAFLVALALIIFLPSLLRIKG
jgi:predicted nucleic acid-binding Zn ribbon protein